MNILKFAEIVCKLKKITRTGWTLFHVPRPESVADHSLGVAFLAMILAPRARVDQLKVIKMALIHDLAESITGDIVTEYGSKIISDPEDKKAKEIQAMKNILSLLDNKEYFELFREFEQNKTLEANFVKGLDKLEMAIQANDYEKLYKVNLQPFFENVRPKISDKYQKSLLNKLEKSRKK